MVWIDIYINKIVTKLDLQNALAEIFDIKKENVRIIADLDELGIVVDPTIKVICKTFKMIKNENYKLRLQFSLDNSIKIENDIEIISQLIYILKCKILVENYLIDPSTMLEISEVTLPYHSDDFYECKSFTLP